MKNKRRLWGLSSAVGLLLLILDSKTAITGGQEGIKLCFQTVIPALFPFFVFSGLACQSFLGENISILRPIGKLCRIPKGAESLLLLGFLGGYPVGAKNIVTAEENGALTRIDAQRMMGFCNNAGPAFLFGMAGGLFESKVAPWILWFIHIISAILVGCILPNKAVNHCKLPKNRTINFTEQMKNSIKTMGNICAWVMLFRVILTFLKKWFFFLIPTEIGVWVTGLTELSNGIIDLYSISNDGLRFILCAGFLGFGGVCVGMQTISITSKLGTGLYFPGKIIQGCISILIAYFLQFILFEGINIFSIPTYWLLVLLLGIGCCLYVIYPRKNNSGNLSKTYV